LSLVSREIPDSLIENPNDILKRVKQIIELGTINSLDGKSIKIKSDTICVHGDNPNAIEVVRVLSKYLDS